MVINKNAMYINFIEKVLGDTSEIALKYFGKGEGSIKDGDNNQVLTEADLAIGQCLIEEISEAFPDHNIIDEEMGVIDKNSRYTWVVDPIDGTSNFVTGSPLYGTLLGLLDGDQPIAGGATLPSLSSIYIAEKGSGSYCNGERINVSSETQLSNCLVAYGIDGYIDDPERTRNECRLLAEIVLNIRNLRTSNSVFDSMMVASGVYGAQINNTSKIWDNVALQILIEEAGGVYTDAIGNAMDYSNPTSRFDQNYTWACGVPAIHKKLVEIVKNNC